MLGNVPVKAKCRRKKVHLSKSG